MSITVAATPFIPVQASAADNNYPISDINVIVDTPADLYTLTRNVSKGNRGVEILDTEPEKLYAVYQQRHIYLDVFPEDLSYEILLTAVGSNEPDSAALSEEELQAYADSVKSMYDQYESEEFMGVTTYSHNGINYTVTLGRHMEEIFSAYTVDYQTIKNGIKYDYILQTNNIEPNDEILGKLLYIIDSANYTPVKASITESPFFTLIKEYVIGGGITIGILFLIIYLVNRSSKKNVY